MNYSTVYVGMDVHKESFSFCCYTNEKESSEYCQKVDEHYRKVLNCLEAMRSTTETVPYLYAVMRLSVLASPCTASSPGTM